MSGTARLTPITLLVTALLCASACAKREPAASVASLKNDTCMSGVPRTEISSPDWSQDLHVTGCLGEPLQIEYGPDAHELAGNLYVTSSTGKASVLFAFNLYGEQYS